MTEGASATEESADRGSPAPRSELAAVIARLDELLGARSARETALVDRLTSGFDVKAARLVEHWLASTIQGRGEEATRAVHTLRGAALNLGSVILSQACEQIESSPLDGAVDSTRTRHRLLTASVAAFVVTLTEAHRLSGRRETSAPDRA